MGFFESYGTFKRQYSLVVREMIFLGLLGDMFQARIKNTQFREH